MPWYTRRNIKNVIPKPNLLLLLYNYSGSYISYLPRSERYEGSTVPNANINVGISKILLIKILGLVLYNIYDIYLQHT